jgi:O-antigen ligase
MNEKLALQRNRQNEWFRSERISFGTTLLILGSFALLVALFGGTSRPDQIHHAVLRPSAALFLIPALYLLGRQCWREEFVLLSLLGCLVVWMGLQLIPLPPHAWQSLPGRGAIAQLDHLAGLDDTWRPLALSPTRGLNALSGLVVPTAALLLAISVRSTTQLIFHVILAVGVANAALGFVQLAAGPDSQFYLYAYAPASASFGLFANRNHGAVFSVLALLIVARLMCESYLANKPGLAWTKVAYPLIFFVLLLSVLVTGSRTALFALFIALTAGSLQALALASASLEAADGRRRHKRSDLRWFAALLAASALGLIALFIGLERAPALERLLAQDPIADLRWRALPILQEMVGTHWLWGSGFGSFDVIYQTYEPTDLLMVAYFNQAHNDWLQLVIEGGVPACLLLVGLILWAALTIGAIMRDHNRGVAKVQAIFWIATILVMGSASLTDYPLRTPIYQAMGVWLMVALSLDRQRSGLIR